MKICNRFKFRQALSLVWLLALPAVGIAQHPIFETVNNAVAARGHDNIQLSVVEWITAGDEAGQTVFFNNRGNKQFDRDWVPGDPRNDIGLGTALGWGIDGVEVTADVLPAEDLLAIGAGMQTWQDETCSFIPLVDLGLSDFDYGFVQWIVSMESGQDFGGSDFFFPFLAHSGFLDGAFFDEIVCESEEPGCGADILGITFTFVWIDGPGGPPTDVDNNNKFDTAFSEIYYNDDFDWGDGTDDTIDIQTVALHEAGHGLSQAHFGKLHRTDRNGKFHFSPRAVMNAGYTGVQRSLAATDSAGHCSNWASWPNN